MDFLEYHSAGLSLPNSFGILGPVGSANGGPRPIYHGLNLVWLGLPLRIGSGLGTPPFSLGPAASHLGLPSMLDHHHPGNPNALTLVPPLLEGGFSLLGGGPPVDLDIATGPGLAADQSDDGLGWGVGQLDARSNPRSSTALGPPIRDEDRSDGVLGRGAALHGARANPKHPTTLGAPPLDVGSLLLGGGPPVDLGLAIGGSATSLSGLDLPDAAHATPLDATGADAAHATPPPDDASGRTGSDPGLILDAIRSSARLLDRTPDLALGRAIRRKARLLKGETGRLGPASRNWNNKKIKTKATLCRVILSDAEAAGHHSFIRADV